MFTQKPRTRPIHFAVALLGTGALFATSQAVAANSMTLAALDTSQGPVETVVVTGSRFNPDIAPSKASLNTTQPQTIINKSYIEDSVAQTSDYVTILAIVPSLSGLSINGPGLSDGNVKNTLRGLPDGNFGMSYDGIPFGDTNGPTHHSESYFPSSTIGSVDVDRGPGNAGTLGASTYGGTINLFSEPLADGFPCQTDHDVSGVGARWNFNTNLQTGTFEAWAIDMTRARELPGNRVRRISDVAEHTSRQRFVKVETDVAPGWTSRHSPIAMALFRRSTTITVRRRLRSSRTASSLRSRTPIRKLPTYAAYNPEFKQTDMDYLRLHGDDLRRHSISTRSLTHTPTSTRR